MVRGIIPFKCNSCGKIFLAPDVEYYATVYSHPQECPKCHSMRTTPLGLLGWLQRWIFEKASHSLRKT